MKISADFTVIPDDFAKAAAPEYFNGGVPVVSFPFYIDDVNPEARYLHWEFVDPDSIPVCGFEWIHWSVANLPIDALMYDFNDSHALAIPPDFSRQLPAMIPETVQGRNSSASKFLGRSTDPSVIMRYNGPQPLRGGCFGGQAARSRRTRIMSIICRCGPPRSRFPD